jgi:hypothetical protein
MGMGYPESPDIYQAGLGEGWETTLDNAVKASQGGKTSPRSETPATYPGRGLAPAMATLGSSPGPEGGDFSREKAEILKTAPRGKDGHPLAPNGQRSNLTEDQWASVRTKNFKKWFGDWHGILIRENLNGTPLADLKTSSVPTGSFAEL